MKSKFERLCNILENKTIVLTDAIEKADPTTLEYKDLLVNFDVTMGISANISRMISQEEMMQVHQEQCQGECCATEDIPTNYSKKEEE